MILLLAEYHVKNTLKKSVLGAKMLDTNMYPPNKVKMHRKVITTLKGQNLYTEK
jgi:hypothetical protein